MNNPAAREFFPTPSVAGAGDGGPPEPAAAIAAIESLPHVEGQIVHLWKTRALNTFIHHLLLDTRDGGRRGFPRDVAGELVFIAEMNQLVRAQEAAPLLHLDVEEARALIARGDLAALRADGLADDPWAADPGARERSPAPAPTRGASPRLLLHDRQERQSQHGSRRHLPILLHEAPPLPASVVLDLTAPATARTGPETMDWGLFRCLARELGGLKVRQLVLASPGDSAQCPWLPSAVRFARDRCHVAQVVLQVDPLATSLQQLAGAMAAGLTHLVLNCNLADGSWRQRADAARATNPDHFPALLRRLVRTRDREQERSGRHCTVALTWIGHDRGRGLLSYFSALARQAGLAEAPGPDGRSSPPSTAAPGDHCWAPFMTAHVRCNGHLVACAQDHSGYSYTADLKQTGFAAAWLGLPFRKARHRVLQGQRPGKLCGICPHLAARETVPAAGPDRGNAA